MAAVRAEADRREGLARLTGQVETMRARVESTDAGGCSSDCGHRAGGRSRRADEGRVRDRAGPGRWNWTRARSALTSTTIAPSPRCGLADERVAELQTAERAAERQVASLRARIEALAVGLDRKDGAAWLIENRGEAGL